MRCLIVSRIWFPCPTEKCCYWCNLKVIKNTFGLVVAFLLKSSLFLVSEKVMLSQFELPNEQCSLTDKSLEKMIKKWWCGKCKQGQHRTGVTWLAFFFSFFLSFFLIRAVLLQILEMTSSNWHSQSSSFISILESSSLPDVWPWLCCFLCLSIATLIETVETNAFIWSMSP